MNPNFIPFLIAAGIIAGAIIGNRFAEENMRRRIKNLTNIILEEVTTSTLRVVDAMENGASSEEIARIKECETERLNLTLLSK